jgi:two-component system response regulator AlgR
VADALRALIVDDEPLAIERLQILCARIPALTLLGTATEGASALRLIRSLQPDLVLLDIEMPGMDGMALARAVADLPRKPAVIFVTAFDRFAVEAFDVAAVDYLLKPVEPERLERAIARLRGAQPRPAARFAQEFWVPGRHGVVRVAARDIDLVEAERDYMRLHVGPRSFLLHQTITALEQKLDPEMFVRLHRSTLVRRDRIVAFHHNSAGAWETELADGRRLKVGRTYLARARALAGRSSTS